MTMLRLPNTEYVDDDNPLPVSFVDDVQSARDILGTTKQVSVGTSATLIAAANPLRRSLLITQITGAQIVYVGFHNGVTSSIGHYLGATAGNNVTIYSKWDVWGIAASAPQTVSVLEESLAAIV